MNRPKSPWLQLPRVASTQRAPRTASACTDAQDLLRWALGLGFRGLGPVMAPKSFRVLIAGPREVLGKRFRFLGLGAPRAVLVLWVLLRTGSCFFVGGGFGFLI